ncbi:hypothetical protein BV20DRAFT_972003 [Pilatotrama ljubarskyi]|nr:hypothetical protein BV20DRAFT_972003 [Pilatotrama ljubarskyi]
MSLTEIPSHLQPLLTLRHPNPRKLPPLPKLQALFSHTLQDAKAKKAEKAWLTLITSTLMSVDVPDAVPYLYHFVTRDNVDSHATRRSVQEAADKAELMREAMLKGIIFVGMPRSILSLESLYGAVDADVKNHLREHSLRAMTPANIDERLAHGKALMDSIYPEAAEDRARLSTYHPDFSDVVIQSYAATLAPLPGGNAVRGNLDRALTSVVGVACLRSEGGVGELLDSHFLGLLRARDVPGLTHEDYWVASDEGAEWVLRTVDAILDVVKPELGKGGDCGV